MKIKKNPEQDKKVATFMEIDGQVALYSTIVEKIKMLGEEKEPLRKNLLEKVELIGNKDDKGSHTVVTSKFVVVKQRSVRTALNKEKARAVLMQKGLLKQVEKTTTYLDEDEIAKLVDCGKLTPKEVRLFTDVSEQFSLVVKKAKKDEDQTQSA